MGRAQKWEQSGPPNCFFSSQEKKGKVTVEQVSKALDGLAAWSQLGMGTLLKLGDSWAK